MGSADRPLVLELLADKLKVFDGSKLLHKQAYAAQAVQMSCVPETEATFVLVRRAPTTGQASAPHRSLSRCGECKTANHHFVSRAANWQRRKAPARL